MAEFTEKQLSDIQNKIRFGNYKILKRTAKNAGRSYRVLRDIYDENSVRIEHVYWCIKCEELIVREAGRGTQPLLRHADDCDPLPKKKLSGTGNNSIDDDASSNSGLIETSLTATPIATTESQCSAGSILQPQVDQISQQSSQSPMNELLPDPNPMTETGDNPFDDGELSNDAFTEPIITTTPSTYTIQPQVNLQVNLASSQIASPHTLDSDEEIPWSTSMFFDSVYSKFKRRNKSYNINTNLPF